MNIGMQRKLEQLEELTQRLIGHMGAPIDCPPRGEKNEVYHCLESVTTRKAKIEQYSDRLDKKKTRK